MSKQIERSQTSIISVHIDRIEDGLAVIILSQSPEIHFNLPLQYLPANATEGDHLKLTFELDAESAEAACNRVAELQAELSSEPETNIKL